MNTKLSRTLSGIAGEYFAAGQLTLRNFHAAITLRNNEGIDILATKFETGKSISVQVKTAQNKRRWPLSKKVEEQGKANFYFIFVNIKLFDEQEYFIIRSTELAKIVKEGHQKWLKTPGKNGKIHNDNPMREFQDKEGEYLNKWDILEI